MDTDALALHAMRTGVCVAPSSAFDAFGRNHRAVRINFTLNEAGRLEEGVRRLAQAFASMPDTAKDNGFTS